MDSRRDGRSGTSCVIMMQVATCDRCRDRRPGSSCPYRSHPTTPSTSPSTSDRTDDNAASCGGGSATRPWREYTVGSPGGGPGVDGDGGGRPLMTPNPFELGGELEDPAHCRVKGAEPHSGGGRLVGGEEGVDPADAHEGDVAEVDDDDDRRGRASAWRRWSTSTWTDATSISPAARRRTPSGVSLRVTTSVAPSAVVASGAVRWRSRSPWHSPLVGAVSVASGGDVGHDRRQAGCRRIGGSGRGRRRRGSGGSDRRGAAMTKRPPRALTNASR